MHVYQTIGKELAKPDNDKKQLHKYHAEIEDLVEADVIGITGQGSKIRQIILSKESNVSELENWLGCELELVEG